MGRGWQGTRERCGRGGVRHSKRKGSSSEPCPVTVFIHSKESSLTGAQQAASGTCLITRHRGDSNL